MVITFTYKPSLVKIDARNVIVVTDPQKTNTATNLQTDRTDYNTQAALLSLERSVVTTS